MTALPARPPQPTRSTRTARVYGPEVNGLMMTPRQFDRADFDPDYRYELVNGVCIVAPLPDVHERELNDDWAFELGCYQESPNGHFLDDTLPEHTIAMAADRRRADRVIWCGLGRRPKRGEMPTIAIDFVSMGRRKWQHDYEVKRDQYLAAGIREYWIVDRFKRTFTAWIKTATGHRTKVLHKGQTYYTDLLPGFVLSISQLMENATRWEE